MAHVLKEALTDIHVGLARRNETIEFVRGDARRARWEFDVTLRRDASGVDFGGPFVAGKCGERYFGLRWGTFDADGTFTVFRGAKLRIEDIDRALIRSAIHPGNRLVGKLGLTDAQGWPICASVRPPKIAWSVSPE